MGWCSDGFDELHTDSGRRWRRGSAAEERCQAIGCHLQAQRQAYPPLARRRVRLCLQVQPPPLSLTLSLSALLLVLCSL